MRHRRAYRTPTESRQEYLTRGSKYTDPHKTQEDEGSREKNRSVNRTVTPPWRVGELKQGSDPHIRATESEEKHLRLRVKQLICGSLNGKRIRQSLLQPYIPQTGMLVPPNAQQLGAGV